MGTLFSLNETTPEDGFQVYTCQRLEPSTISDVIVFECGDANHWAQNDASTRLTRSYLNAAMCSFSEVIEAGANLRSTTFVLFIPGNPIQIKSGKGYEFQFCQNSDGTIEGYASCMPFHRRLWNGFTWLVKTAAGAIASIAGSPALRAILPL